MSRNLRLEVLLQAVDRVTGPMRKMREGTGRTAQAIKASRDEIKRLERAQRDMQGFARMRENLRGTSTQLDAARERLRQLNVEKRRNGTETARFRQQYRKANEAVRDLTNRQRQEINGLQEKSREMKQAGINVSRLGSEQTRLANDLDQVNRRLEEQQNQLRRTTERQQQLAKARQGLQKTNQIASSMMGAGARMSAAGAAVGYTGSRLMAPGMDFEESMSNVQALTRLEKTDPQLQALQAQLRELGATTSFSATQAADAAGFLAMAGFDPRAIMDSMPGMLDLSRATNTELARTADITSNIMGGFGLKASEMSRVGDILVAATTSANVNLEMLGESMKYVGPVARDMGVSLEESAAMAGLLGDVGIQGSQAGTSMRAIISRLTTQTGAAKDAMEALGVETRDADGNLRSVPRVIADIAKATKDMGNAERGQYLQEIFGREPAAAIAQLINEQGAGGIDEFVTNLQNAQGESARVAKTMGDNARGDLTELASAWADVGISLHTTVGEPLRETIQRITQLTGKVSAWIKANPELTATILKWGGAIAGVLVVGGTLLMFLGMILKPLGLVLFAIKVLAIAFGALSLPVLAVIAAVAAFAAAVYLVYKNWDKITAWVSEFISGFQEAWEGGFMSVLAWTGELIGNIAKVFLDFSPLGLLYKGIAAVLSWFGVDLPDSFSEAGVALINGLVSGITGRIKAVKDTITSVGSSVSNWFKDRLGINSPSRVFAEFGGNTLEGYEQGVDKQEGSALKRVKQFAKNLVGIGSSLNYPAPAYSEIRASQPDGLANTLDLSRSINQELSTTNKLSIQAISMKISPNTGTEILRINESLATTAANSEIMVDSFQEAWEGGFMSVLAWTGELIGNIAKVFLDFSPLGLLYKGIAAVLSWFGVDLPGSFTEAGGAVMDGLVSGITGRIKAVKETITNVGSSVSGWFKDTLGINSPSRVFAEFGGNTLEGYEEGVNKQEAGTLKRVKDFAKNVANIGSSVILPAPEATATPASAKYSGRDSESSAQSKVQQEESELLKKIKAFAKGLAGSGAGVVMSSAATADNVQFDTRGPVAPQAATAPASSDHIEIHIHTSQGMSAQEVAAQVQKVLEQRDREKARRRRASLTDRG